MLHGVNNRVHTSLVIALVTFKSFAGRRFTFRVDIMYVCVYCIGTFLIVPTAIVLSEYLQTIIGCLLRHDFDFQLAISKSSLTCCFIQCSLNLQYLIESAYIPLLTGTFWLGG